MSDICPTITAYDVPTYKQQLELLMSFANRIHIDLMDGNFAPTTSPNLHELWWPKHIRADLHIMYQDPMAIVSDVLAKHPNLTIVHHESLHASSFVHTLHEHRLKVGIALLAETPVEVLQQYLAVVDHVLIFSGNLGHHGGQANMQLLEKVAYIRQHRPNIEIGWDGGINAENIMTLLHAGVTVYNVGGAIHSSESPQSAYENLQHLLQ